MNFDYGELFTRAGQIAWKHKILWLFSALPTLLSFTIFPVVFLPILLTDFDPYGEPFFVEQPAYIVLLVGSAFSAVSFASSVRGVVATVALGGCGGGGAETCNEETVRGRKIILAARDRRYLLSAGGLDRVDDALRCMALLGAVTWHRFHLPATWFPLEVPARSSLRHHRRIAGGGRRGHSA